MEIYHRQEDRKIDRQIVIEQVSEKKWNDRGKKETEHKIEKERRREKEKKER